MFVDINKLLYLTILINLTVLSKPLLCLRINEQNLTKENESSAIDRPMIHSNYQAETNKADNNLTYNHLKMLDIVNNLIINNTNSNFNDIHKFNYKHKLYKKPRSSLSVVYSDLNDDDYNPYYSQDYKNDNNKDKQSNDDFHSALFLSAIKNNEKVSNLKSYEQVNRNSREDYLHSERISDKNAQAPSKQENERNELIHMRSSPIEAPTVDRECENESKNLTSRKFSNENENENINLLVEMSTDHDFGKSVKNSGKKNENNFKLFGNAIEYKNKSNIDKLNSSNKLNITNKIQHRSTDTYNYETPFNFVDDYSDFKFLTRQPSSQHIPNQLKKINQHNKKFANFLPADSVEKKANYLFKNNLTPYIDLIINKLDRSRIENANKEREIFSKQFRKRLDSIESNYNEDDEFRNQQDDLADQNGQDLNYDFEYSKEFQEKDLKNQLDLTKISDDENQIFDQIHTQIQNHNYNQNLDKLISKILENDKKMEKKKKFNNYYLQYIRNHPPTKYIPLNQNLKSLKKTKPQSKIKEQLNMDRRSLPADPYLSPLLNFPVMTNQQQNWYLKKQRPKIDENLYRKLIWLRKQSLINSILTNVQKQSIPFKMINHELQPDSSDDLYSYSPIGDLDLGDYENDIAVPQAQSMPSLYNYPPLMSYYPNPIRYYNMPPTPLPSPPPTMIMPTTPMSYYDSYNRYNMPPPSSTAQSRYPQDDYHRGHHTEHHHEHTYAPPMPHYPPPTFSHIIRNYKKNDIKDMLWPLLFAVVLPLTFGALLLPLTLMFLVNLFMLLQILRNPNLDGTGNADGNDGTVLAKINKYKSELLSLSPRTDLNSTELIKNTLNTNQNRSKRSTNKSVYINQEKLDENYLRLLTALVQMQQLLNQPNQLKRNKYFKLT